jgi:hypothetical protein
MNVRVLFILLLVSVLLAFTPRFRRIGLTSCALLVALLMWINLRESQQPDEPSQTSSVQSNSSSTAAATQPRAKIIALQLDGRGAPWHLIGRVQNISDSPIQWVRLNIERYDCPTDLAVLTDCNLLWQGEHIARLPIAAGATGKIDESFYSHVPVPAHKGVLRDRILMADAG